MGETTRETELFVRLSESLKREVRIAAAEAGVPMAEWARDAFRQRINDDE